MAATYEQIKNAVFYAHEKPELLADIIAELGGVEKTGADTSALEQKVTNLETRVQALEQKE